MEKPLHMQESDCQGDAGSPTSPWGVVRTVALCLLLALSATLFLFEGWLLENWKHLSVDEVIFHLQAPLEGTNPAVVLDGVIKCALPALVLFFVLVYVMLKLRKRGDGYRMAVAGIVAASIALVAWTGYDFESKFGLFGRLFTKGTSAESDEFFSEHYVDAANVGIRFPEQKRNLVYIFLESMEMTYADEASGGAFPQNVIPELTALSREAEDFSGSSALLDGAISYPGATWTTGAMFAQTTGVPLKQPISADGGQQQNYFVPGIRALGDVLASEGYRQKLVIGSDATFGARDWLFTTHGGYEIYDYNTALEEADIPEGYMVFWGFEDEKLFDIAKRELLEMAEGEEPFNFTMLTVDTHFEDGYVCELCGDEFGANQYANVMACSSRQVSEFVRWIQEQDFYENTTVVLCGDHITMDADFCDDVPAEYPRRTYTAILNSAAAPYTGEARSYSTYDMYPTTLASLGATIEGERLGLGVNLYSSEQTLTEEYGADTLYRLLEERSLFLENLSGDGEVTMI